MARGVLVVSGMNLGTIRVNMCSIGEAYGAPIPIGPYPLDCTAADPAFLKMRASPPMIREAGERLYAALVANQPLRDFFLPTLPAAQQAAPLEFPLYIRTDAPDAETFPWEVLYEQQKNFMSLDQQGRWPIGRLVATTVQPQPLIRVIGNELRLVVILAAARENGVTQWAGIATAIGRLMVPVDLLVIVSEDAAKQAVEADAAQWQAQAKPHSVSVQFAADADALMYAIRTHVPNVVHFFCHGQADSAPRLEVESRSDRRAKKADGSIRLESGSLAVLGKILGLWGVILNCCKGGSANPQLHSMARELVASGVPAVVAMRESVDVSDANTFAEHFYGALFPQLQALFAASSNPALPRPLPLQEMIWMRAVHRARVELARGDPESSAQWTYPVLYVHRDNVKLQVRQLKTLTRDERLQVLVELDMLRALRATYDLAQDPAAPVQIEKLDFKIREIETKLSAG